MLIKSIQEKQTAQGKTFWKIETDDGWYGLWDPAERPKLVIGETAECETETKGKYKNILKVLGSKPQDPGKIKRTDGDHSDQRASIETQTAYKGIVELMVAGLVTKDSTLGLAALRWAAERLGQTEPTVAVPVKGKIPDKTTSTPIKDFIPENIGQMLWYAGTKGKSRAEVLVFLGEKDSEKVKVEEAWPKVRDWLKEKDGK